MAAVSGPVGAVRPAGAGRSGRSGRRELAVAVLTCTAGALLALACAGRSWRVDLVVRPEPLPVERVGRTGAALLPWLPAVALAALAGGGALLATRGAARRSVGALLVAAGLGIAAGSASFAGSTGSTGSTGSPGSAGVSWLALAAGAGGLLVAAAGGLALARAHRWPAMGARYERPARSAKPPAAEPSAVEPPAADFPAAEPPAAQPPPPAAHPPALWDALDRGEDPTAPPADR